MGFIAPRVPELDDERWRAGTRMERIKPMVQDWAESGFGTPESVFLLYLTKIGLYILGAATVVSFTDGVGGIGDAVDSWAEPIAFQKVVVYTLLFEVLGFGCGFGPLTLRFVPPVGGFLHWLRPRTIRLPPFPGTVPYTGGSSRTLVDVLLYAGLLLSAASLLFTGTVDSELPRTGVATTLVLLGALGLRDKTIFLAARAEVYGTLMLTFMVSGDHFLFGSKMVVFLIWWGAAFSKLNRHFPSVISVMASNSPVLRSRRLKRTFFVDHPDDIRPSSLSRRLAHGGTAFEFVVPLVLLLSRGGTVTTVAAAAMIVFHLIILVSIPLGVPLEWNVFMIYAIGVLFVENAAVGFTSLTAWTLLVVAIVASLIVMGNLYPARFSFLIAMRYYAGNWATSLWLIKPSAIAKIEANLVKSAPLASAQLDRLYGAELTEKLIYKGAAFRVMHSHGRALYGLIPIAAGPAHESYLAVEGELFAGMSLGWNFGDGHLHDEQLIEALQERCRFEPGEVRAVLLESQPMGQPTQAYRLVDAALGTFQRGTVLVTDMLERQPWSDSIPVEVADDSGAPAGYQTDLTNP